MTALEMDPAIRARWVAALRSGDYEQGHGALRQGGEIVSRPDLHCCLGVLCDLAEAAGVIKATYVSHGTWAYGNATDHLPPSVMLWARLDSNNPHVDAGDLGRAPLAFLNDEEMGFDGIADLIEGGVS